MPTPLEISFHGLERSEAVEARIRTKLKRIEDKFDRLTHARVVVAAPAHRNDVPKLFHVRIELGVPGHPPIVVKHEPEVPNAHADVMLDLRDAFNAAQRQVDQFADKIDKPARREQARRRPARPQPPESE